MYLLLLTIILIVLIIVVAVVSNPSTLNSNEIDVSPIKGDTITVHLSELRQYLNDTTISIPIAPDGVYEDSLVSRGIQITDISRTVCQNKPSNDDASLGLYNMSILKQPDGYSGIIRGSTWNGCCEHNTPPSFSYAYYINLDDNGTVRNLDKVNLPYDTFDHCTKHVGDVYANGIEDPRVFLFKGEEWVIGNALGLPQQEYPCVNMMCIFKVSDPITTFRLLTPPHGVSLLQRQKNWSPFEYEGELYCEYSIEPHSILKIDLATGLTTEAWITGSPANDITSETSLRGGAPPILITNPQCKGKSTLPEKFYLGVGHTRTRTTSNYLHFFYVFEAAPPFNILRVTPRFKLDGNERIQFAAGLSADDTMIYISYGVDDCYNRISRFYITDILHLL